MRVGLVGTGPWARSVHGPALARSEEVDLVGVWGRDPDKAGALAATLGVPAFPDYDQLVENVDAMAFAVPPDVQVELAVRAARAGRHLLLEKPVATDLAQAHALADEVDRRGVASVVFFTDRFAEAPSAWFEDVARIGGWHGGSVRWLAALATPGNPYADSAWRWERGALWDIGPHVLSTMTAALGPVRSVAAHAGAGDLVHLVLAHEAGPTSTATLSLQAPAAAADYEVLLWGDAGVSRMPPRSDTNAVAALERAVGALRAATEGAANPVDVRFGVRVVELLQDAERQLGAIGR